MESNGKDETDVFQFILDAFSPRLKMPFGQRHVAINIYNICRGHFDQPCTMFFFFQNLCVFCICICMFIVFSVYA